LPGHGLSKYLHGKGDLEGIVIMNPTSKQKCIGIAKLHPQSASIGLKIRIQGGGGLLGDS